MEKHKGGGERGQRIPLHMFLRQPCWDAGSPLTSVFWDMFLCHVIEIRFKSDLKVRRNPHRKSTFEHTPASSSLFGHFLGTVEEFACFEHEMEVNLPR